MDNNETHAPTLLSVRQFAEKHAAFSQGAIRALIFGAYPRTSSAGEVPSNGFDAAIVRIGRRVLIDEHAFFRWIAEQQTRKEPA